MTIATELQRIIDAKAAIKAAIIEKGVDVPDTEKLDVYHEYIDQITGGAPVFPPDLSKPLDKEQLDNLQNIVGEGKAPEYLSLGDKLLVNYGSYVMPFEVVGFEDIEVEGGGAKHSINLLAQYTGETGVYWGGSGSPKYSVSTLRATAATMTSSLNSNFTECLGNTKVDTYSIDGSIDTVYDKLFAPSMSQLGVTDTKYTTAQQTSIEGPAFTGYEGAGDGKRIKQAINATTTDQGYWTRSLYPGASGSFGVISPAGRANNIGGATNTRRVLVACNLIGK